MEQNDLGYHTTMVCKKNIHRVELPYSFCDLDFTSRTIGFTSNIINCVVVKLDVFFLISFCVCERFIRFPLGLLFIC